MGLTEQWYLVSLPPPGRWPIQSQVLANPSSVGTGSISWMDLKSNQIVVGYAHKLYATLVPAHCADGQPHFWEV